MGGSSSKLPPVAVPTTEEKGVQTAPHCGTHEEIMQREIDTILEMSLGRTVPPPTTTTPPPQAASQTENLPEASPPPTGFFQPIPPTRIDSHVHEVPRSMLRTVSFGPIRFDIGDDFQEARRQVDDLSSKIESLGGESRAAREDRRQQKRKAEESVQSQLSALQAGIESIQKTQEFREYRADRRVRREQKRKAEESVQSQLSALQAGLESIQKNQESVLEALDDESTWKRAKLNEVRLPELNIVSDVVNELMVIKEDLEEAVMNLKRPGKQPAVESTTTRPPIDAMVRGHHALNLNIPSPHYNSISASKGPIYVHDIEDAHRRGGMVPASPIAEAAGPCKHGPMHTFDTSCLLGTVPSSDSRGNTTSASDSASPSSSPETPIPRCFSYGGFRDDSSAAVPESPIQLDYDS